VFFGTPSCGNLPGQISHPTLLYVLADVDLPAPALVPAAAVVGLASCGRLRVAEAREVLGALRSSIRGDAYGAAMNELEVMERVKQKR
jgi:hypothetical protein